MIQSRSLHRTFDVIRTVELLPGIGTPCAGFKQFVDSRKRFSERNFSFLFIKRASKLSKYFITSFSYDVVDKTSKNGCVDDSVLLVAAKNQIK